MHAAPSVIIFTVLSGAGFGYLAFLALGLTGGTGASAFGPFALAFALAAGGLMASTFHLGQPKRAMRAFTQWRTSWLSREAWASVAALCVMGLYAIAAIFFGTQLTLLGFLGAALSLATVFATSMIYAQLATVPRWNSPLTPASFLGAALTGGAILSGQVSLAILLLMAFAVLQAFVWMKGDSRFSERGHSIASATGLTGMKDLRLFESPHTGDNYLLREFVHEVGRKHAQKLRVIGLIAMTVAPILLLLALPNVWPVLLLAFAVHLAGMFVSRWLFFAEAEHVVRLYYGKTA
ncbi:dimethyl sulfoxide reductase anchor subunit family protein [Amaricoccus macauensis]|uniref:dimethyl sulfoxide reductase anchor subunit family protein n=1 Tax=Amaricoccus macauensis TaxID=57001 RepID=UPI003C7D2C46